MAGENNSDTSSLEKKIAEALETIQEMNLMLFKDHQCELHFYEKDIIYQLIDAAEDGLNDLNGILSGDSAEPDHEDNIIELEDDDGNSVRFEILDIIEYQGREFAALTAAEDAGDTKEVVILEAENWTFSKSTSYKTVDDEGLLRQVFGIFKQNNEDLCNFVTVQPMPSDSV